VDYVNTRTAFGKTIGSMQNTGFSLADLKAGLSVGWAYVEQCLAGLTDGSLTTERASIAKFWVTGMRGRLVDRCLRFCGGCGFMREYEISRLYADARVHRICGGTSEIMREIIAGSLCTSSIGWPRLRIAAVPSLPSSPSWLSRSGESRWAGPGRRG